MKLEITKEDIEYYGASQILEILKTVVREFEKQPKPVVNEYSLYSSGEFKN